MLARHPLPQLLQVGFPVFQLSLCLLIATSSSLTFFLRVDTKEFSEAWQAAVFVDWQVHLRSTYVSENSTSAQNPPTHPRLKAA
jgi:hypothetical protein